jgi:hypothetical protein
MKTGTELDWAMETEPWGEAVDGKALLDELAGLVRRYVVLPRWGAETLALWVLHAYAFELRDVMTYLVKGRKRRGSPYRIRRQISELRDDMEKRRR